MSASLNFREAQQKASPGAIDDSTIYPHSSPTLEQYRIIFPESLD
jgi:hypothetical protein